MNKKVYIMIAAAAIAFVGIGVYFFNQNKGNDFIDFTNAETKVCSISNTAPNVLLTYTEGEQSYVGVLNTSDFTIVGECELPFENNENIYIEQSTTGELFISNGVDELFKYNGSHFLKVPYQTHTVGLDIRVTPVENKMKFNLQAGSVNVEKEFTHSVGYNLKNAYVYSDVKDKDTINLYDNGDPGSTIADNFIVMRVEFNETVFYAFFDEDSKELLRLVVNPFETTDGAFYATIENDKPLLFVGGQAYDVNANEMIAHDAITIDENAVSVETVFNDELQLPETKIKSSDGQVYSYLVQSKYAITSAYIVYK